MLQNALEQGLRAIEVHDKSNGKQEPEVLMRVLSPVSKRSAGVITESFVADNTFFLGQRTPAATQVKLL